MRYPIGMMKHGWAAKFCQAFRVFVFLPFYFFTLLPLLSGCSVIDEDQSDCGQKVWLYYDLQLVTNLSIELQKQLDRRDDVSVKKALRVYLSRIFNDYGHDLDLSFYDIKGNSSRLHHEQHIMDANLLGLSPYLSSGQYMHTALANLENNQVAILEGENYCHSASLLQLQGDTVSTHKTGLFTARQMMQLNEGVDQVFYVHLYMANCAAALVLDTSEATFSDMNVVASGFASRFEIADSSFVFAERTPVVKADKIETGKDGQMCFCTVNFPSRDVNNTRIVIETEDPFVSDNADEALWQMIVYATLPDGKVTQTLLGITKPLRAGQLKIIRCKVKDDGSLIPEDSEVSTSVTLDWKEGLVIEN